MGISEPSGMPRSIATVTGATATSLTESACSTAAYTSSTALREPAHTCKKPVSRFHETS